MLSRQVIQVKPHRRSGRLFRCRGAEPLEFTLVLLPLFAMTTVLVDTAWGIFAKSTLQRAVRLGVRTGVTLTASQMAQGACLTDTVKSLVQQNSLGILNGSTGLAMIKVNYLQPPQPDSSAAAVDVSNQSTGDSPGNIMVVSVQNYSLIPLMPRVYSWHGTIDNSPLTINVSSADLIEPSRNVPCIGTAP
jgi:Flp pilus assembly protein TadG